MEFLLAIYFSGVEMVTIIGIRIVVVFVVGTSHGAVVLCWIDEVERREVLF